MKLQKFGKTIRDLLATVLGVTDLTLADLAVILHRRVHIDDLSRDSVQEKDVHPTWKHPLAELIAALITSNNVAVIPNSPETLGPRPNNNLTASQPRQKNPGIYYKSNKKNI